MQAKRAPDATDNLLSPLYDPSSQTELRLTVYIAPGVSGGPLIKCFAAVNSPLSMNNRCLGIFLATLIEMGDTALPPGADDRDRRVQAAAWFFASNRANFRFELDVRTFFYKVNVGESMFERTVQALEVLELTVVLPVNSTRRNKAWLVILPDGSPVSHVCRAVAQLPGVSGLVIDFQQQGLVAKGRAAALTFDRDWAPSGPSESFADKVVVAGATYGVTPSLTSSSTITFYLYGPLCEGECDEIAKPLLQRVLESTIDITFVEKRYRGLGSPATQ